VGAIFKNGEGLAISTSFDRLKKALSETKLNVNGGLVQYVDYETHRPDHVNILLWAMLKRISFEHEKEFRAVVLDLSVEQKGVYIPIIPEFLIDEVYVSPTAKDWTVDLLRKIVKRCNFDFEVKKSELLSHPIYYQDE
jgi:hypothetical protein